MGTGKGASSCPNCGGKLIIDTHKSIVTGREKEVGYCPGCGDCYSRYEDEQWARCHLASMLPENKDVKVVTNDSQVY